MDYSSDMEKILASHSISMKTVRRGNGTIDSYYSIQFTYPKGQKHQFTGKNEKEVRHKVFGFFNISLITFRDMYEKWQNDEDITEAERTKARTARYGFANCLEFLGDKLAAEVSSEDIINLGKHNIAKGYKTGTVNTITRYIGHLYDYGIKKGFVKDNPARSVKPFRLHEIRFERAYLTDEQIYSFLSACNDQKEYVFAAFFICGIGRDRFVPLRWKDVDFNNLMISISRKMESRKSFSIIELERTEKIRLKEPKIAFEFLKLELNKQAKILGVELGKLAASNRFIVTHCGTDRNTSWHAFSLRLDDFLRRRIKANYNMADVVYSSAVYAFKAECDLPSVASIIGYGKAIEMFRNPEKYDLFERKKNRSVNEYFDELYSSSI